MMAAITGQGIHEVAVDLRVLLNAAEARALKAEAALRKCGKIIKAMEKLAPEWINLPTALLMVEVEETVAALDKQEGK